MTKENILVIVTMILAIITANVITDIISYYLFNLIL